MGQRTRAPAALSGILLALVLGACGGGGNGDARDAVSEAVTQFVDGTNRQDFAAVCDLLAASEARSIASEGRGGCAQVLRRLSSGPAQTRVRIDEVRVSGERASVDATFIQEGGTRRPQTLGLVKEDGDWRIATVSG
jgi:ketosteroid isomerase-like protein